MARTDAATARHRAHVEGHVVPRREAVGLWALGAVMLTGSVALTVHDGWGWLLGGCGAAGAAGGGAWVADRERPRSVLGRLVGPTLLLLFFGGAATFFFYAFVLDPSCGDCSSTTSDPGPWVLLAGGWLLGAFFAMSAWRGDGRGH